MTNAFTKAEVDETMRSPRSRMTVRDLSARVIDHVEQLGYTQDSGTLLSMVQKASKQILGVSAADERLLAEAEEARAVKEMDDPSEALRRW